jgi:poly-gamma-glutamate synthesis protein (capsule biosynthesis protein)
MGSPYPLSYTLRWPYYLVRPSLHPRGFPERWPLAHTFADAEGADVVRLVFFGDLMPTADGRVPSVHPDLSALGGAADLVVANAEGPVGAATCRRGLRLQLGADYVRAWMEALAVAPARLVVSVANNHAGDAGSDGFDETWRRLLDLGVTPVGSAEQPAATVSCRGLAVGVSAWTCWQNRPCARVASEPARLSTDVRVGYPHWEAEFRHFPRASTRGRVRELIEGGFDLVVGSHTHVVQPVAWIGEGLCAYSLGNLSRHPMLRVRWPLLLGAALEVSLMASGPRRGRVLAYRVHPFVHEVQEGEPYLVPVHAAAPALRAKLERRLGLLFEAVSPGGGGP